MSACLRRSCEYVLTGGVEVMIVRSDLVTSD